MNFYKATREWEGRFRSKVARVEGEGCWLWRGTLSEGYGLFWVEGRNRPAAEMALLLDGRPVDTSRGEMACHHCDRPACVRPTHLYVGTALTNVRDMDSRGRRVARVPHPNARGERNHQAKLSDAAVATIRARYMGTRGEQSSLAREFGVTPQLIQLIVRRGHRAVL